MLLPPQLPTLLTTAKEVRDYLSNSNGLLVPVSPNLFQMYLAVNPDNADVARPFQLADANPKAQSLLDGLIILEKDDNLSELTTTVLMNRFLEDSFKAFGELERPGLKLVISLNKAETGTTSRAVELRKRPDTLVMSKYCTFMVRLGHGVGPSKPLAWAFGVACVIPADHQHDHAAQAEPPHMWFSYRITPAPFTPILLLQTGRGGQGAA